MFTGLVEETGRIVRLETTPEGLRRLEIETNMVAEGINLGASVATNGCCLTVTAINGPRLRFDLLDETFRKTAFSSVAVGDPVNLERSLLPTSRLGGHFVTGHVDGVGVIEIFEQRGANHLLRIRPPDEFLKYLVYKGSVAVDGMSLTVAQVQSASFDIWIIPHTLAQTNLARRKAGDLVNLEFDILAKYVERLASVGAQPA